MAINTCTFTGRFTQDPEMKETANGKSYVRFGLAVAGWKKDTVNFLNCVAWGKTAEIIAKYCTKGNKVAVIASAESYAYEKDGVKKTGINFNVTNVEFMSGKGEGDNYAPRNVADDDEDIFGDDLPF